MPVHDANNREPEFAGVSPELAPAAEERLAEVPDVEDDAWPAGVPVADENEAPAVVRGRRNALVTAVARALANNSSLTKLDFGSTHRFGLSSRQYESLVLALRSTDSSSLNMLEIMGQVAHTEEKLSMKSPEVSGKCL